LSDEEVVAGMRRGDPRAFVTFVDRYHRILVAYARRLRIYGGERDELASELLNDVAIAFVEPGVALPRSMAHYLIGALRNKVFNRMRAHRRHNRLVREAAIETASSPGLHGSVESWAAGCSEGIVRATRGPDWEYPALSPARRRLARMLDASLTETDRELLIAIGDQVPAREIASWMGISHAAVRKRTERLRARLVELAESFVEVLTDEEAAELRRLFSACSPGSHAPAAHPLLGRHEDGER
jgi:RNA polymerase sigma factor (sigma-70 family)